MTTCKGCNAEFRKGTLAFLLTPEGLKGSCVCAACVKRGVLLVPVLVPHRLRDKLADALDRERFYKQACEWYSKPENYNGPKPAVLADGGARARTALKNA